MGKGLLPLYPIFAKAMANAEEEFLRLGADWRLIEELGKPKSRSSVNKAWLSQPSCTAIQIALVDLLESWGIRPEVVCGHSSGEIGAAYAAGILSARDALKVAYYRGVAVVNLKKSFPDLSGTMLAVGLSENDVQKYTNGFKKEVVVACINSPTTITLSGDTPAIKQVQQHLEADGVFNRALEVDVAYHSHHMKLVQSAYISAVSDIKPQSAKNGVRLVSSVTGQLANGKEMDADYWARNLISRVRFPDALMGCLTLQKGGLGKLDKTIQTTSLVIEIGPHAA